MKKLILSIFLCCGLTTNIMAQNENEPFKGYYYNDEYNIYLKIDLHSDGLIVPEHEMLANYLDISARNTTVFIGSSRQKTLRTKRKLSLSLSTTMEVRIWKLLFQKKKTALLFSSN